MEHKHPDGAVGTWGTIYGQVFSVSFYVSGLQGLQPSGGLEAVVRNLCHELRYVMSIYMDTKSLTRIFM